MLLRRKGAECRRVLARDPWSRANIDAECIVMQPFMIRYLVTIGITIQGIIGDL
jgi:hypothetical protein